MTDLSGITVVTLEQAVAAPYVSGRMAEEGARVIKIEREEGDFARRFDTMVKGESAYFVWLNAGKESITLNLRDDEDQQLLRNLLSSVDVFIQNLAPGALSRLGFTPEYLRNTYPQLIVCSISGYGEEGPYRDQKAYDLLIQAESGLCSITGVGEELTRVGVSVSDISAGMTAYQEILLALFARERDSERQGRLINVSLFHSTADWMNVPYLQHRYGGFTPQNHGLQHPSIAPYGAFICADGKQILFAIQNEREWVALCRDVLGDENIATNDRFCNNEQRLVHREVLETQITEVFRASDRETIIAQLDAANIAYGRVSDLTDLAAHPQNRFRDIDTPNGRVEALGRGAEVEGRVKPTLRLPDVGQDSERIREEFRR